MIRSNHRHPPLTLCRWASTRLGFVRAAPLVCVQHGSPLINKHVTVQASTKPLFTEIIAHARNVVHDGFSDNIQLAADAPSNVSMACKDEKQS